MARKYATNYDDDDKSSEGPEKWYKKGLWPKEKWTKVDEDVDLSSMYDARRKE